MLLTYQLCGQPEIAKRFLTVTVNWLVVSTHLINIAQSFACDFNHELHYSYLIGGFNPFEKYARQIGNLPQSRGENNKYLKPPPSKNRGKDPKVTEMMPFGVAIKYQISTKSIRNGSTSQNIKMVRCVACLTLLQTCF